MATTWIDFRALRAQLKIADVLKHHGVQLKVRGDQASGFCPLPGHADSNSPSFSVHLGRGCFNCFGCQKHGNAIDLEMLLQGLDPADTRAARKVALELVQRFHLDLGGDAPQRRRSSKRQAFRSDRQKPIEHPSAEAVTKIESVDPVEAEATLDADAIVNPPLGFVLQNLDPTHPYLTARGFAAKTIEHFGLGFCAKGMLKDRIAIPLHTDGGELVGYAGRMVDDDTISPDRPKYLFPGRRDKGKKVIAFRKSMLLYNANRIEAPAETLVIVEGFASVWWLWQHGIRNVVALMGASASEWQIHRIATLAAEKAKLFVFPDGDEAGVQLARELLPSLAARRWTTWVKLLADEQPTDVDGQMLNALLMP